MMSNSLKEKLFWLSVIFACALLSILNADSILGNYSDRTSTLITFVPVRRVKYPTLVFCPKNADGLQYSNLLKDFLTNVGTLDNSTAFDVMRYVIAGSGFDNANLKDWSVEYREELNAIYHRWKADRTVLEFFDFIFNQNGYRCEEFFDSCWAGSQVVNCCAMFKPTYVMLRGRCFRLIDDYNQTDVDETDKLSLNFNDVQGKLPGLKTMAQVVMYVGDSHPEVGIYPRTYLNRHDWNRVRFIQRRVSMLPDNPQCSLAPLDQGKSTCFVYNWLTQVVLKPLNCTLPYFKGMLDYGSDMPVCEPSVIVNDYERITSTMLENYHCLPACERVENQMQMITSPDYSRSTNYSFRVETSFTDLQYERYSEIRLTTSAGFISELGGQSGLFVGCSVMSIVQLMLSTLVFAVVVLRRTYLRYFALALHVNTKPPKKIEEAVEEAMEQ